MQHVRYRETVFLFCDELKYALVNVNQFVIQKAYHQKQVTSVRPKENLKESFSQVFTHMLLNYIIIVAMGSSLQRFGCLSF